jgi:hypothetical protein
MSLKRKLTILAMVIIPPVAAMALATAVVFLHFEWSWGVVLLVLGAYAGWIAVLGGLAEFTGFFRQETPPAPPSETPPPAPPPAEPVERRSVDARQAQIGVIGAHAHIEGGVHFHEPPPLPAYTPPSPPPPDELPEPGALPQRSRVGFLRNALFTGRWYCPRRTYHSLSV